MLLNSIVNEQALRAGLLEQVLKLKLLEWLTEEYGDETDAGGGEVRDQAFVRIIDSQSEAIAFLKTHVQKVLRE